MNPIRTTLIVLGTAAVAASASYFATRSSATTAQRTQVQTAAPAPTAHGVVGVGRPAFDFHSLKKPAPAKTTHKAPAKKKRVQDPDNIPAQSFKVKADEGAVFTTAGGCTVQVPANAFVDAHGNAVSGAVTVDVKEVLKPVDYVLGNMMTVYNGKPLESAGTFSITASAHGEELALADGAVLNMGVPSRSKKNGMKFFPGEETANGVTWEAPEQLEAPKAPAAAIVAIQDREVEVAEKKTNLTYTVEDWSGLEDFPGEVHMEMNRLAWESDGWWLERDTTVMVGIYKVLCFANDSATAFFGGRFAVGNVALQPWTEQVGTNSFNVDEKSNYVFQVKQLGWANIDRLLYDKRTKPVELITNVHNDDGMKEVCITLVMKSHGLYLPGYQCKDGSYGFSHGDFEPMQLPVGAKATVLCTAQKDGQPWYAMQEITIAEKGTVDLTLEPTTDAGLREALMARL